jgi:hypothetical protein
VQQYFQFISLVNALVAFTILYLVIRPKLNLLGLRKHLMILVGFHLFRYIGLTLYLPNHFDYVALNVPESLAMRLAYWDFLNGILALIAFIMLWKKPDLGKLFTWIFVIVAMADQTISGNEIMQYITESTKIGVMPWLLVTFYLPLLVVTSIAIIQLLITNKKNKL